MILTIVKNILLVYGLCLSDSDIQKKSIVARSARIINGVEFIFPIVQWCMLHNYAFVILYKIMKMTVF